MLPRTDHRRHKRLNNGAENSHLPTRKRERILQRFKSAEHAQRFLGPFRAVSLALSGRTEQARAATTGTGTFATSCERLITALKAWQNSERQSNNVLPLRHVA